MAEGATSISSLPVNPGAGNPNGNTVISAPLGIQKQMQQPQMGQPQMGQPQMGQPQMQQPQMQQVDAASQQARSGTSSDAASSDAASSDGAIKSYTTSKHKSEINKVITGT